ncbi:hypothetical protein DPMN_048107 [Dreissena polymorpha]|uniref:Uncharacterized protein n=1 Tax=Dreissena polymorpha TaxID=45954 RepID=A0A9D4I2J4_DREPO|nr:hypothetical protein DPMN_048107 [Dreissena polymorpha]
MIYLPIKFHDPRLVAAITLIMEEIKTIERAKKCDIISQTTSRTTSPFPCMNTQELQILTKFDVIRTELIIQHPGSHVLQQTRTIFIQIQDIIKTNILTKFHEDSCSSRVKNAPPLGSHVFQANTNLLTKFHDDWTINAGKLHRPPGGHVFKATKTILELIQDIIWTNLLTKFHEDRKINVPSRVLTRNKKYL